jgi:hypothetical protein
VIQYPERSSGFCRGKGRVVPGAGTVRFGSSGFDARTVELRRHGVRVRLHERPFRIRLALPKHPGEVVLRDEVRPELAALRSLAGLVRSVCGVD